jgi:hypothetical protein
VYFCTRIPAIEFHDMITTVLKNENVVRAARSFVTTASTAAIAAIVLSISTGCVEEKPVDCSVTITPDWSNRSVGIDPPGSYTVMLDDYTAQSQAPSHTVARHFLPATYPARLHNMASHIGMEGYTVTVDAIEGMRIHNTPGWLFTCATEIAIDGGRQSVVVAMQQQVRQLTLIISPSGHGLDHIEGISGVLTGVAGSLDWQTGVHGTPSRITLDFKKITFGDGAGKWRAVVRLLGVAPEPAQQMVELKVTLADPTSGTTREMDWSSEVTGLLEGVNSNKEIPLSFEGIISPDSAEIDFSGTIIKWMSHPGGTLTAQ